MPKRLTRKTWRKYAGCVIRGKEPVPSVTLSQNTHLERAAWLTSMVESGGFYGTVQNFDGTGMTAGIHQAIAVYPKELIEDDDIAENDQGPLWELLMRISNVASHSADNSFIMEWIAFAEALLEAEWYISPGGVLCRQGGEGHVINGYEIRDEFTGSPDGLMPVKGEARECAEEWLWRFHKLFSHRATFPVQQQYGKEHICKSAKRRLRGIPIDNAFYRKTIQQAYYGMMDLSGVTLLNNSPGFDLALCMFWNYNVNAPGKALMCIRDTTTKWGSVRTWGLHEAAKDLIQRLGNNKYGRWDDDLKNGRYQRTRKFAMKVWPRECFTGKWAVMPKDLEG